MESELLSGTGQVPESTPSDGNSIRPPEISGGQLLVKDELSHPSQDNTSESEMLPAEFSEQCRVWAVTSLPSGNNCSNERVQWRQQQLKESFIESNRQIAEGESSQLSNLLAEYHDIFSLKDDERGETDLVEFKIDTGVACPKRQAVRRILFAAQ